MLLCALLLAATAVSSGCLGARLARDYGARGPQQPAPQPGSELTKRQAAESCECIEYYLCINGTIDTTGGFALDKRLGEITCPALQVCCKPPPGDTVPRQPQTAADMWCGLQRNDVNSVDQLYSRIHDVDDREAYYGEFPWMLAVLMDGKFVCGASLIHPQVALTAAHCFNGSIGNADVGSLVVRVGEWDPTSDSEPEPHQDVAVVRVVQHPRFQSHAMYHNVALLELARPLTEGRSVGLVCVATSPDEYNTTQCLASGWGTDEQGVKPQSFQTTLRRVELPIVPHSECQSKLRLTRLSKYFILHDSFICSGGKEGKDTCKGDGGGPLVCALKNSPVPRYVQVGIVSWGVGCGDKDVPAVYADVAKHAGWIAEQLLAMGYKMQSFQQVEESDTEAPQF